MVRSGTSRFWPGLELSRHPRINRERDLLDAFSGAMVGVGALRRERDPGFVLVLEHRRQPPDVSVFSFSKRSGRDSRVFAELDHLHPQSDADS